MKFFKRFFNIKNKSEKPIKPSREETINLMYDKELNYSDGTVVEVIYSEDKTHRCIILQSDKKFLTYQFERLEIYDGEELNYLPHGALPGYWCPISEPAFKPVFGNFDELMKELIFDPEYKTYFGLQTLDK